MPVVGGVVLDTVGGDTHGELFAIEMLKGGTVAHLRALLETLDIEDGARFDLHLHVAGIFAGETLHIFVLEREHLLRGGWNDIAREPERSQKEQGGTDEIRPHQAAITDTTGENGNDFTITRHLGGEEDNRNEYEQRAEHIHKVGHEIDVVVEDDFFDGCLILEEVVEFLCKVEDNGNTHYQHNREEECAKELLDNVFVDFLQLCTIYEFTVYDLFGHL